MGDTGDMVDTGTGDTSQFKKDDLIIKRKKGRPRKDMNIDGEINKSPEEKKKRGRKKKEIVVEEVKQKKKRGRKAAVKYFSSSIRKKIPLTTVLQDSNNFILHLDVKDESDKNEIQTESSINGIENTDINIGIVENNCDKSSDSDESDYVINSVFSKLETENRDTLNQLQKEYDELLDEKNSILGDINEDDDLQNLSQLYEERIKFREHQDNILVNQLDEIRNDLEPTDTEVKVKVIQDTNRKRGYFEVLSKFIHNTNWLYSTDVCCWWCCHHFDSVPIGLPQEYNYNMEKFRVKGVFCSFSCMLAYKEDQGISNTNYLIKALYCKLTCTLLKDAQLKPAPPRYSLKMFGGELTIEDFRQNSKENKIYKMIDYPMYISRDFIEELDIKNVKAVNKNVFQDKNVYNLDDKLVEDAKNRLSQIEETTITLGNTIDKFIKFC